MPEKLADAKAPGNIKQCTRTCFFLLIYFVVADGLSKSTEKGMNTSAFQEFGKVNTVNKDFERDLFCHDGRFYYHNYCL